MAKVSLSMNRAWFVCPGCKENHAFTIKPVPNKPDADVWEFNGDVNNPTFSPSLHWIENGKTRCHLFVRNGKIEFLNDCAHELAGKIVEMDDKAEEI